MKKIISLVMCITVILGSVFLCSCGIIRTVTDGVGNIISTVVGGVLGVADKVISGDIFKGSEVEEIDGMPAEDYFNLAYMKLEECDRYSLEADLNLSIAFIPIPTNFDDEWIEIYDGDDFYYGFDLENHDNNMFDELFGDLEDEVEDEIGYSEVWYIDGMYYVRKGQRKETVAPPIYFEDSEFDRILGNIFYNSSEWHCYKNGFKGYRYEFEIDDSSRYVTGDEKITITIFVNKDGNITRAIDESKEWIIKMTTDYQYSYGEDADKVTPPKDIHAYK